RVALVGDSVHLLTAFVMAVVLVFVMGFGHRLNDVLTQSLAMRYENVDLIVELRQRTRAAYEARGAAESANRAKSQLLAAASHDLRQPLHALGLYVAALAARARDSEWRGLIGSVQSAAETLDLQFAQLLDLSRLEAGALRPERQSVALAIVRGLADLLRHDIGVVSRVGRGSRFSIVAPRAREVPLLARRQSTNPPMVRHALDGAVVAVVDDDTASVDAMRVLFETWGAIVVGGADVEAVLDGCGNLGRYPDLIVADLRLGGGASG